jgi:hypothetical protein
MTAALLVALLQVGVTGTLSKADAEGNHTVTSPCARQPCDGFDLHLRSPHKRSSGCTTPGRRSQRATWCPPAAPTSTAPALPPYLADLGSLPFGVVLELGR